jgi:hypothetical protein
MKSKNYFLRGYHFIFYLVNYCFIIVFYSPPEIISPFLYFLSVVRHNQTEYWLRSSKYRYISSGGRS